MVIIKKIGSIEWKYVATDGIPLAYETGHWDGKRSDQVLVVDELGRKMVARVYEGTMDGAKFLQWVDNEDYEIRYEIVKWLKIPE